ncbi:hypothetical protein [Vibrio cholerae]|uniref:hypothetical protein n=1 Tax=Vibrio cholerae TaxID=666 RepID=UPI001662D178|nr:hypothetical protein [Vibrio cholerae]GFK35397.1 hypothetical protein VcPa01_03592 [Vibrio cholerae]GFK38788.1 hypothetical protein VcPa02_03412 [Vibrio cholerae]GFK42447.1 hypothetical protein VcPa03_03593 [Vibrio cholerae]GFK45994.1 hypothetical protein VcPa04_03590 [Vibrio cholerae]GFK49535.1 hypothetical protein VcPa05_03577 [Vibrio cholerae]
MSIFRTDIKTEDPSYKNLRDGSDPAEIAGKELTETLWKQFEPFSDVNFTEELAIDFDARFWEMDLTVELLKQGLDVSCPKPGPDVCVINKDQRIWFEAICPKAGSGADEVPSPMVGGITKVPEDQIKLRYTSAIQEKFKKYERYCEKGTIEKDEPYIIAINSCQIPSARADFNPPRIVRTVFPIGGEVLTVNRSTGEATVGFEFSATVQKASGTEIDIQYFIDPKYSGISGILFSYSDCCNRPVSQNDWVFIHNPLARNPIANGLISCAMEYVAKESSENAYELVRVA